MKLRKLLSAAAAVAFSFATAQISRADSIVATPPDGSAGPVLATIYTNISNPGDASDPNNYTGPTHASFNPGAINFNSNVTGYTVNSFLNNPTFFNVVGAFDPNGVANNIGLHITGSTFLNAGANSFVVPHDDGITLSISGVSVLFEPGPTSENDSPFTVTVGTSGYYTFDLHYTECCGAPAVLRFDVNGENVATPEPGSIALLGTGLLGLAGTIRRKFVA